MRIFVKYCRHLRGSLSSFLMKTHWRPLLFCLSILFGSACGISAPTPDEILPAPLLYLSVEEDGSARLWRVPANLSAPVPLTPTDWDIFDYALSPDGELILLTHLHPDNSSSVWILPATGAQPKQLLDCAPNFCRQPIWQPNGGGALVSRYDNFSAMLQNQPPAIWWVDTGNGSASVVELSSQQAGYGVTFSPNGDWFSYGSPIDHSLALINLATEQQSVLHVHTDKPIAWNQASDSFVVVHNLATGARFGAQLHRVETKTGESLNLTGEEKNVEDSLPAWSPDGEWIVFGRRFPQTPMGRQIWLMGSDGDNAHPLTDDALLDHTAFRWSPQGNKIVYQTTDLNSPNAMPSLWMIDVESQERIEIAGNGMLPSWLPN